MAVVEYVISHQGFLVCNVLLLHRAAAIGLYQALVGYQVPPVIHDEAAHVGLLTHWHLLQHQFVEVSQSEVSTHHGHHPVSGRVQCLPAMSTFTVTIALV